MPKEWRFKSICRFLEGGGLTFSSSFDWKLLQLFKKKRISIHVETPHQRSEKVSGKNSSSEKKKVQLQPLSKHSDTTTSPRDSYHPGNSPNLVVSLRNLGRSHRLSQANLHRSGPRQSTFLKKTQNASFKSQFAVCLGGDGRK